MEYRCGSRSLLMPTDHTTQHQDRSNLRYSVITPPDHHYPCQEIYVRVNLRHPRGLQKVVLGLQPFRFTCQRFQVMTTLLQRTDRLCALPTVPLSIFSDHGSLFSVPAKQCGSMTQSTDVRSHEQSDIPIGLPTKVSIQYAFSPHGKGTLKNLLKLILR